MKIFDKFETAQTICEELYERVSAQFRAGFSIRINGGTWNEMREHSDWMDGKSVGWSQADELIMAGTIFSVYPFECDNEGCPTRFQYGGYWACNKCNTHINTPEWWKIRVFKDGNMYCCVGDGFVNLQETNNYAFGSSFQHAINEYRDKINSLKKHSTMAHSLRWFTERIGKSVVFGADKELVIENESHANDLFKNWQHPPFTFRDPHPLTSSILTCSVISCDRCGKIGTTEDLDKEVAAKGFEGEGWKRLEDGTINCGCKK